MFTSHSTVEKSKTHASEHENSPFTMLSFTRVCVFSPSQQVVRSLAPVLDKTLHPQILSLLPAIFACVCHEHALVRVSAAKCITAMAKSITDPVMAAVLTKAVPMLGNTTSVEARQGAGILVSSTLR